MPPALDRPCSVARSVDVLGDRWTFLILRECFFGSRRFDVFQESLGIARNILADRLKKLVRHGVLKRQRYQARPPRYEYRLTEQGLDLYGVIVELIRWGDRWLAASSGPPLLITHDSCGCSLLPQVTCSHCGEAVTARAVSYRPGPGARRKKKRAR